MNRINLLLLGIALSPFCAAEQFPPLYNSEPGAPMSAQEALGKLRLPEGFTATLFASEPEVQNPIAATWDHKGRLWVAENYTYAERQKRFDLDLNDRVIVLEDTNHDGVADKRKIFTDQVKMLTSVEVGRGGVWLMCPPQLLFIPDADGDDVPDGPPEVVLDGFTVAKDNYHNLANGLRWGPDGWLYGRCGHACPGSLGVPGTPEEQRVPMKGGIWRYHPDHKAVEVLCQGTTNPWGHDWDQHGEMFFTNTVNGHLWNMIPGGHFKEHAGVGPHPLVYERLDQIADHYHYDTTGSWQESRDGKANDFGGGHSHIGGMIYQADQWPEIFRGKYMTLNQHGRRINVERLDQEGGRYVGRHEPDIVFSDDPWFVGLDLTTGPDGSVFILDWSDTGECHDHSGVHRESGRIFKISYGQPSKPDLSILQDPNGEKIEAAIRHPNVWFYRQLQVLLMKREITEETRDRLLQLVAAKSEAAPIRLKALWILHAQDRLDDMVLASLLGDSNRFLRIWALRLLSDRLPINRIDGRLSPRENGLNPQAFQNILGRVSREDSALVRTAMASLVHRLPANQKLVLASALVQRPEEENMMSLLLWPSISGTGALKPQQLADLASVSRWPTLTRFIARYLSSMRQEPDALDHLLSIPLPEGMGPAVLQGMIEGHAGISSAREPEAWKKFAGLITDAEATSMIQRLSIIFGDLSTIDSLEARVLDAKAPMGQRQAALDILIDAKVPKLRELVERVVAVPVLNGNALRAFALTEDIATARLIAENYTHFLPANRSALMDIMVGRPGWAGVLLDEIAEGRIPPADLPAYSARRIRAMKDDALTRKLDEVWGSLNESPEHKRKEIESLKSRLTPAALAAADLSKGREVHSMICGSCHMLYGDGGMIGPDLTGSGRANLDYLLENIIDPSAVVSSDYRITTLETTDGRQLAGSVAGKTANTLTLRLPAGEITVPLAEISKQTATPISMMPEGLLTGLSEAQIRDLIAYLMHPSQVPLPAQ